MELVVLTLAGIGTALATGLGALPVSRLGAHADVLRPAVWGLTVGNMSVASVVGLLLPALDEGSLGAVVAGFAVGVAFLLVSRAALETRDVHVGQLRGAACAARFWFSPCCSCTACPKGWRSGRHSRPTRRDWGCS